MSYLIYNGKRVTYQGKYLSDIVSSLSWQEMPSLAAETVNPSGLRSVYFIDENTGWAVGDSSSNVFIAKTSDGGATWNEQSTPILPPPASINSLNGVIFVNSNIGWAVGEEYGPPSFKVILKTTNGGTTWVRQTNLDSSLGTLNDVFFTDQNNGWGPYVQEIMHTSDGGSTWTAQTVPAGDIELYSVFFLDSSVGWACGVNYDIADVCMLNTTDGGANWSSQTISLGETGILYSVYFIDENNGWAVGNSEDSLVSIIFKTTNGGTTWTLQSQSFSNEYYQGVKFKDLNTGWIVGLNGSSPVVYYTSNAGGSWTSQPLPPSFGWLFAISVAGSVAYSVGTESGNNALGLKYS
jgi:photosystem II stability/assembly factor-like uncharacterized protein